MIPATASPEEIAWTFLALLGATLASAGLAAAIGDWRLVRRVGCNEATWVIARQNVRTEAFRLSKQLLFLLIGVVALFTPPSVQSANRELGALLITCLLLAEALMVAGTALDYLDRRRLLRGPSRIQEQEGEA